MNNQQYNDPEIVREAQDKLRSLGIIYEIDELRIPTSGTFDDVTDFAVRSFQRRYGITETGKIDSDTWERLKRESDLAVKLSGPRRSISPYPSGRNNTVNNGERSELVFITQLMLNALSLYYDFPYVPINGIFDTDTSAAVREFQLKNMMEATGILDPLTWDLLADEYNITVRDSQ